MRTLLALLLLVSSASSFADKYTCHAAGETRYIVVEYDHKGWDVPCKVRYEKPDQDVVEYPWTAKATPGYCEDRAEFLANKLASNWGWVCSKEEKQNE